MKMKKKIGFAAALALLGIALLSTRYYMVDLPIWRSLGGGKGPDPTTLHLQGEFVESNLGTAEGPAGSTSWASGSQGVRRAVLAGAQRYGVAMMLAITVPLAFQFPLSTLWNAQTYRISSHVEAADAAMAKVP